ncbi:MAG: MtrB/PioB family outer membrane beta-barrel protein [Vicinamibacterales bacterium]
MKIRAYTSVVTLGIGVLRLTTVLAYADHADGQEATPGNALNPRAISSVVERDPEGLGIAENSRTPTGLLILPAPLVKEPSKTVGGLLYRATVEFGAIGVTDGSRAAKFREYKDLDSGAYLNNFTVMFEKPTSAFHFDAVGGGVARTDQYYGVDVGRYNTWRVRGSFSEIPHVFTTTYKSLWDGAGSDVLTLKGLRPGGTTDANTTQANILLAISSTPVSDLELTRKKSRARVDLTLPANWKAFASYAHERREGSRPFAAVFGGGGGGGNVEIPESIDYNTQDVLAGLQFANATTNVSLQAAASFFQNDVGTMTFQNPLFITTNTIAGVPATTFTQGQFDLYPSNDYYNLKGEFARKFPKVLNSRVTGVVSLARSQQNDNLIPWAIEPLTGGTINGVSTANAWNTTASLSRLSADARIDTTLVDVGILLNPARALAVKGNVRYYDTDNSTQYRACNPLTGQWGRLLNNGSGGSFVTPNLTAGNNPVGTLNTGYNRTGCDYAATRALGLAPSAGDVPIGSAPYEYRRLNSEILADYRLNRTNSLEAAFARENFRRRYRERDKTWEDKIRLGYVNRDSETGTLRLSYEYGRRRGSDFVAAPLAEFYSSSLGPVPAATTTNIASWLRNVDQFRRFDVADRNQHALSVQYNYGILPALDASVGLQVRDLEYPASEYGRNEHQRLTSPSVELNWQPSPSTSAYGFYSFQQGRQRQAGIQPNACVIGNFYYFLSDGSVQTNATGVPPPGVTVVATQQVLAANWRSLCGTASAVSPLFPISRTWDVSQKDRNTVTGLGFHYELGRVMSDLGYTYSNGRTRIRYGYNPAALGLNAVQVALAGDGFADLVFVQNLVEANASVPLLKRLSLRLLYRFEDARIRDWHYSGVSVNPMPANNGAYLDFGPQDYKVHLFGALFRYEL